MARFRLTPKGRLLDMQSSLRWTARRHQVQLDLTGDSIGNQ